MTRLNKSNLTSNLIFTAAVIIIVACFALFANYAYNPTAAAAIID